LQRLKTRSQFQAALAGGTVARTNHFALHCASLPLALNSQAAIEADPPSPAAASLFSVYGVWMGAMVPKRWAKRAVTRNAIKRQIYNVSQEFEALLPVAAHVVRLRSGFDKAHFISATSDALKAAINQELRQLFTRAAASAGLRAEVRK
jgi:ribonuclease P protein component